MPVSGGKIEGVIVRIPDPTVPTYNDRYIVLTVKFW